ncbi:MAG: heavy metal-binding domain-containing protein, partial [Acidobacteriota bacterium]|nr:heavy metal-binding domain-containing protein [Acidobacteriota bacterium]
MDEPEHHCCHGEGAAEVESGGKGKVDVPASVPAWVCPMCPSVREPGPGACPMCGMALESEEVVLEDDNPELNNMRRRFYVSLVFTVPVFVLAMSEMVPGQLLQE